jgi:hypothetical protein
LLFTSSSYLLTAHWFLGDSDDVDAAGLYHGKSKFEVKSVQGILEHGWDELSMEGVNNWCSSCHEKLELVLQHEVRNNFNR